MDMNAVPRPAAVKRGLISKLSEPKSFLAEIVLLLAGAGSAQAIVVMTAPLLSRLYTPAEFAGVSLLASVVAIVSRISSFKYETAISTGRNRPEMGALAAIATWVLFGFALAALVIPAACLPLLERRLGETGAVVFVICLPIVVLFDGLIQIVITWAIRWRQFKTVSANDLIRNGGSVVVQAAAGLARLGGAGLMFGQTVGTVIAFAVLTSRGTLASLLSYGRGSSWRRRRVVAKRFNDFPLYQMPRAVLMALTRNLPPILIAGYYSAAATGLFWFAFRLTLLPANLISLSVGRVLTQRFANLHNVKRTSLRPLLIRSTLLFMLMAAPVVLVATLAGPQLFALFLGGKWIEAGRLAAWTSLWSAGIICATPAQTAMTIQRKNGTLLIVELLFALPRTLPFPYFASGGRVDVAVAWCCSAGALYSFVLIVFAIFASKSGTADSAVPGAAAA